MSPARHIQTEDRLKEFLKQHPAESRLFLQALCDRNQPLLLRTEIYDTFNQVAQADNSEPLRTGPFKTLVQ